MKFFLFSILLLAPFAAQAQEKLPVASLSTVLTEIAREVGGDKVEVTGIIKPGTDPHTFTPTTGDVKILSHSKVVLLSGYGMEASYLGKLEKSVGKGPEFVSIGPFIKPIMVEEDHDHQDHGHSHGHGHSHSHDGKPFPDPHWWHSIKNVEVATDAVLKAFIKADPANAATYKTNAAAYTRRLEALAKWAKLEMARLPRDRRILVTSHDAFGYFARDYGFKVLPIAGLSTKDQPSSQKVRAIIEAIKKEGVKAIFVENIENPKVLTEITRETGAKKGGTLYADGLGTGPASTYEGMIRHNYSTIVSALE